MFRTSQPSFGRFQTVLEIFTPNNSGNDVQFDLSSFFHFPGSWKAKRFNQTHPLSIAVGVSLATRI